MEYGYKNSSIVSRAVKRVIRGIFGCDFSLLVLVLFLIGFGLVMIYSSSYYNAAKYYSDPLLFVNSQFKNFLLGLAAMAAVTSIDYHVYIKRFLKMPLIFWGVLGCMALQVLVLVLGETTGGAQRWIPIGGIKFQPSEVSKIVIIIYMAFVVQKNLRKLDTFKGFFFSILFVLPVIVLVLKENLSTAIVMVAITGVICFVASRKIAYFVVALGGIGALGYVFITQVDFRSTRIDAWLDVENHPKGYQTLQSLYAIADGGLFGKGLGGGLQKLGYIPEVHNDMIFSIICEELGLFGAAAILIVFIMLLWRIYIIAVNARDLYGSLIATGVFVHIAVQLILNVAVVTNTIPNTGIPLPFISYGGTSLIALMIEIGLVLSVSSDIRYDGRLKG